MLTDTIYSTSPHFLNGGGKMGALIRGMDWSNSELGNPQAWPVSLQTATSICLNTTHPMVIWWGEEFYKIYNDAYDALLSIEKAETMGGKGADVWFEAWPLILPMLKEVMLTGEASGLEDQLIQRNLNGRTEKSYFTFSYSAIHDELGKVAGIFCMLKEQSTDALKESEERMSNLVANAPYPICILKGKDMVLVVANDPLLKIWGLERNALGQAFAEIVPPPGGLKVMAWLADVYKNGATHCINEEPAYTPGISGDQQTQYFNFVYQPYREAAGNISGVMVMATEVTGQVEARKNIEAQAALVNKLLLTAPAFICTLTGPDHVYDLINDRYQQLFGTRKIHGKPIMEALPELAGQGFDTILHNVYNTGETFVGKDMPVMLAAGENLEPEVRFFNFSYQPMYSTAAVINAILVFGYEVTDQVIAQKRVEVSEAHLRMLSDLMPAKITNSDANGAVSFYNNAWFEFTGMGFEELKDFGYQNIIHPDDLTEFKRLFAVAASSFTDLEMEMRLLNRDGEYKWHLNRATPVRNVNGQLKMWIGVTTEIEKIKEEERLKNNFLSMASHELKTPLTTIKAYGQMAELMLQESGDEKTLAIVMRMGKQIDKLNNLIGDLLDFTKIKKGKLIYHESFFDFNEFVQEILDDMEPASATHRIERKIGETAMIFGDRNKLGQVLINLISNAIKYSPKADHIVVTTYLQKSGVKLSVGDFGIGILPGAELKVFEEFYRVSGDNQSSYPGMGIGLYISSEIIKNFHGSLWLESSGADGSVFSLFVPFDHRDGALKSF